LNFLKNIKTGELTDKELITEYKKTGDVDCIGKLYQRYMDLVFGVCLKYFKDAEKSKDAVMEIYSELCLKLRQYEVENFKPWLSVVSRNYCLMQLRSPRSLRVTEFDADVMQTEQITHPGNEILEREADFDKLEECIALLPTDQRQSIRLFYLEKKCYNEIAGITGFEWSKVRSLIQNGKRNLKICLSSKGVFDD